MNCVKIFRYFDYGTCHCYDLFITDASYNVVEDMGIFEYGYRVCDFLELKTRGFELND